MGLAGRTRLVGLDPAKDTLGSNRVGTDELLGSAEMVGTKPKICVKLGLGCLD